MDSPSSPKPDSSKRVRNDSGTTARALLMCASSPPRMISMEEMMAAAKHLENMAVVHELALNDDFKLKHVTEEPESLESKISEIAHRAFWDVFQERLSKDPPDYAYAVDLFAELKEKLLQLLLPQHRRLREDIMARLDADVIRQQVENDTLEFKPYADYILDMMSKLCAPVRDEEIAAIRAESDLVKLFRGIFETLNKMHIDMANFTLTAAKPEIEQNSVEYEREQFKKYIETTKMPLLHTESWLHSSLYHYLDHNSGSDTADLNKIMTSAYIDVLDWPVDSVLPETLQIDAQRLRALQCLFLRLQLIASSVAVACSASDLQPPLLNDFRASAAEKLDVILKDVAVGNDHVQDLGTVAEQCIKLLGQQSDGASSSRLSDDNQRLIRSQIEALHNPTHAVRKVMHDRILTFVESVLTAGSGSATAVTSPAKTAASTSKPTTDPSMSTNNVQSTTTPPKSTSQLSVPNGLNPVQKQLAHFAGAFLRVVSYNRHVFAPFYDEILRKLIHLRSEKTEEDKTGDS